MRIFNEHQFHKAEKLDNKLGFCFIYIYLLGSNYMGDLSHLADTFSALVIFVKMYCRILSCF
jgi:hypothetical protein